MTGLSRTTGRRLDATSDAHLAQSITDIITTPLGSRVLRRTYGSEAPALIDQPMNARTRLRLFAATALAVLRWEPRVRLRSLALETTASGRAALSIHLIRVDLPRPTPLTLTVPV